MITDPEQIFSFAFIMGIAVGWAATRLRDVIRRMDERERAEQLSKQQFRMRQWDEQ